MRDDIEKGPRFEPSQERQTCVACGLRPGAWNIDRETGLDLPCWRAWRFAAQAACPDCIQPAGQPHGYRCPRARASGAPMMPNPESRRAADVLRSEMAMDPLVAAVMADFLRDAQKANGGGGFVSTDVNCPTCGTRPKGRLFTGGLCGDPWHGAKP